MQGANRGGQIAEQTAPVLSDLLPMERACLSFLVDVGGRMAFAGIPTKLFSGVIPAGRPDLVDLGFVAHDGDDIVLTDAGRAALLADALKNFTEGRDISYVDDLERARSVLKVA